MFFFKGHFQIPFDHSRMEYIYLPPGKAGSYTYNSAVEQKLKSSKKIITLAPNKFKVNEYNESLTQAVVNVYFFNYTLFINFFLSISNWGSNILLKIKSNFK